MGRPPIGKRAMTGMERQRRHWEQKAQKELKAARERIAALEAELRRRGAARPEPTRPSSTAPTRGHARHEFASDKHRAEIGMLKSDIAKLKLMLAEEPDATKLRKKVVELQVELGSLRRALKETAKERDKYRKLAAARGERAYVDGIAELTRANYRLLVKATHPDRLSHCSADELADAAKVVTALGPLFERKA